MLSSSRAINYVLILLCGVTFTLIQAQKDCRMETFKVQSNFDEKRYEGKWYEFSWILLPWVKPERALVDFSHDYTKTDYGLSYIGKGRFPTNGHNCTTVPHGKLYSIGENAKYYQTYSPPNRSRMNATYWIIATDYVNYALVYGCFTVAANGACSVPESKLLSRCPNLPTQFRKEMEARLDDLCLTQDMFKVTPQTNDCGPEGMCSKGNDIRINPFWSVLTIILFMSLMIGF